MTLSKYLASDTGVTMTITLRPAISVSSGYKLVITLVGQPLSGLPSPPLTAVIAPSQGAGSIISSSRVKPATSSEIEFVFGAGISANTLLTLSFGTFSLPASALPGSDAIDAAILDASDNVIAASSQGSFPAIFATTISGSSVGVSSSVANAPNVTVSVTFSPTSAITVLRLTGLTFVDFAATSGTRRLLQAGISCTNLAYAGAGALTVAYSAIDGDLSLTFPGGSASRINQAIPCVCQISGFRNSAAAASSPGIMVTTYDNSGTGSAMQSGVVFPPILCETGYSQSTSGNVVNCAPCAKGTYSDTAGASLCLQCPSGTYSTTAAAASLASCTACPPATFSNNSGAFDASACVPCSPGSNSSLPGSTSCAPCKSGSYAESYGQQYCDLCRAGSYGPQQRASSKAACSMCSAGTFSKNGSIVCTRCPPGASSEEGSGDCQPCLTGTYSDVGGECFKCPGITYSLANGSTSLRDCAGILVDVGGNRVAYTVGIIILIIYMLSFSLVPSWSAADAVMRFQLTANFEGRLDKKAKVSNRTRRSTWSERITTKLSRSAESSSSTAAADKRFFEVGDSVLWHGQESALNADAVIGTVESTSVYPEQDADELGDFVVFVKMDTAFEPMLRQLQDAADATGGQKPVLIDSKCRSCRCQLKQAPASHAHMPVFGWRIGRWEIVRQINACFQLLLMSLFPAIDTISDLVYILSSLFANYYIFAASLVCITAQFWLYIKRLKQRRVFEALKNRRVELAYLKGLSFWPKWASPDSLPVFLTMILPFYFFYHVIFPVVWFLLGYALYSFQLFPISRISNRWLYAFV
jgi:hypothetical protein